MKCHRPSKALHQLLPFVLLSLFQIGCSCGAAAVDSSGVVLLQNGWRIESSAQVPASGEAISIGKFDTTAWHPATVPGTVLGALVDDGVYTNIYFGTNLATIPTAPFTNSWWFRTAFDVSREQAAGNADLIFDGINYRANVWLNGKQIAAADQTFGAFRIFKFDASGKLKSGKNVVAVEVFPPRPGDFTMGFVDWNPKPPDHNMGLFRPVKLHFYKTVALENAFVESKIDHANWQKAALTIRADLSNHSDGKVKTRLSGKIGDVNFSESFTLQPHETCTVALTPGKNPQLIFDHAQLWWPWEFGKPHLYDLQLTALVGGKISDSANTRFGIREVDDYITPDGYRGYKINGKKILIRGGGWADELLLRENEKNLEAQLQYTRAMNLNTIRMEGIWGSSQRIFDLADRYGLLIMAGWSCQWEWKDMLGKSCDQFGGIKSEADMELATNYLHDQVLWLRNHPSIYVWVLGSDKLPRPELETRYDALLENIDPTRPTLKTCGDGVSTVSGPSAVKMNGPYDYVTPNYWYLDTNHGGAFGFNTETGPGPEPAPLESLRRMIPEENPWPIGRVWDFHCARGKFGQMDRYWNAFTNRYGIPKSVEEFAFKSQAANYGAIRPMYEAFAANLPHTTGIIQWMLNPSWPKLYWQLYDYYLVPGGAFFGAKKGAAPFAVIYNYGDQSVYLVNQTHQRLDDCRTTITVYDLNSKVILEQTVTNDSPAYGSEKIFDLSKLAPDRPVYFLDLRTVGSGTGVPPVSFSSPAASSKSSANNFYWLSTKPDVLDEAKSTWFVTPNKSFADFTGLNQMPKANVQAEVSFAPAGDGTEATVTLKNTGDTLAFFIQMRIVGKESPAIIDAGFLG